MNIFSLILSFVMSITPPSSFRCDGELLTPIIRNNLNGDFALVKDLEKVDEGAFAVLQWNGVSLMLPVSFQKGEISFTDKKWLWSYKDNRNGLHEEYPRFSELLPSGRVIEHSCEPLL